MEKKERFVSRHVVQAPRGASLAPHKAALFEAPTFTYGDSAPKRSPSSLASSALFSQALPVPLANCLLKVKHHSLRFVVAFDWRVRHA